MCDILLCKWFDYEETYWEHIHATQKPQWAFFLHHLQGKMSTLPTNYFITILVKLMNALRVIVLILLTSWPVRATLRKNVKMAFLLVKLQENQMHDCIALFIPHPLSLVLILHLYILLPSDVGRPGVPGGCEQQSGGGVGG